MSNNVLTNEKNIACFMMSLSEILTTVRFDIKLQYNTQILMLVKKYLDIIIHQKQEFDFTLFKQEINQLIQQINISDDLIGLYTYSINAERVKNAFTNNFAEINKYIPLISNVITEICMLLKENKFERAYDLIDSIHCLPEALLHKRKWNPRSFWNNYIKPYRLKWNNNFLVQEEKVLKNYFVNIFKFFR